VLALGEYFQKNVIVTFEDGQVLKGFVSMHTSALDDPDGRENITIRHFKTRYLIDAYADEIKDIEVIS